MKKVLFICFACVIFAVHLSAQHESSAKKLKASAGFMLNPQAEISLENIEAGFTPSVPLFILISLEKNNWAITPIYDVTSNSYGGFIKRILPKDLGLYVVILKKVHNSELYSGLGFDFPVAKGIASGFIEPGIKLKEGEVEPCVSVGVSMPLTFSMIKSNK